MSRTLILPDIHNATRRAEELIEKHGTGCERIVLLGDYFDDFGDDAVIAERTANWLRASLQDSRRIHLVGNHDVPYLVPDSALGFYPCAGWTQEKRDAIRRTLNEVDPTQFRLAVEVDGWLISHAGYSGQAEVSASDLVERATKAWTRALAGDRVIELMAGRARGGDSAAGGLTWLDWQREFKPIDGLHQIVGHSLSGNPRAAWKANGRAYKRGFAEGTDATSVVPGRNASPSVNWCIDTQLRCIGILEDRSFSPLWVTS